jgi:putative flavoprotein involved in K+ transport
MRSMIDDYITRERLSASDTHLDAADAPATLADFSDQPATFDLAAEGVTSVVWCTGFRGDFGWLPRDVVDANGRPRHRSGVSDIPGLYFVGFPWLARRDSGIILGVAPDAEHVAGVIAGRLATTGAEVTP